MWKSGGCDKGEKITYLLSKNRFAHSYSTYFVPGTVLNSFHSPNNLIRKVLLLPLLFYKRGNRPKEIK